MVPRILSHWSKVGGEIAGSVWMYDGRDGIYKILSKILKGREFLGYLVSEGH
jgi:hypothetical protein